MHIAMFVPLKGSTAAHARVARRTAGRFKGRNSCLALEGSLHARTHERLFKDARSSTGIPSISPTTSWVLKPTPVSQLRLWVYRTLNILPEERRCSSFSLACVPLGVYLCQGHPPPFIYPCCRVDVDLDVPAIAVIGWQSAGKSSLIEAISGITLPRASGTCTR